MSNNSLFKGIISPVIKYRELIWNALDTLNCYLQILEDEIIKCFQVVHHHIIFVLTVL